MIEQANDFENIELDIKNQIENKLQDLLLVSESDEILSFLEIEKETLNEDFDIKKITNRLNFNNEVVTIYDIESFFENLIEIKEWYGEYEIGQAKLFMALFQFLNENLTDMKMLEIGEISIQIYLIGKTNDNRFIGFQSQKIQT
jgi:hypothetical protein